MYLDRQVQMFAQINKKLTCYVMYVQNVLNLLCLFSSSSKVCESEKIEDADNGGTRKWMTARDERGIICADTASSRPLGAEGRIRQRT